MQNDRYPFSLNLPILDQLSNCKSLLIAGMGGGFDIFCGLPIFFELQHQISGKIHLANLTFSNVVFSKAANLQGLTILSPTLVGVHSTTQELPVYFPELYLSQWFKEQRDEDVTLWCFKKTGVVNLLANYQILIKHLNIDGILLIDGGIDSLSQGTEAQTGTIVEDSLSLAAVHQITEIPVRLIGCLGFGAERDISYAHFLENIAGLAATQSFLGSCSLIQQMPVYQLYENAVLYVQSRPCQESSVINSSIISAVRGHYGNYYLTERTKDSQLWISPLMSIYWFFELTAIAEKNLFLERLLNTETLGDVMEITAQFIQARPRRSEEIIPLFRVST